MWLIDFKLCINCRSSVEGVNGLNVFIGSLALIDLFKLVLNYTYVYILRLAVIQPVYGLKTGLYCFLLFGKGLYLSTFITKEEKLSLSTYTINCMHTLNHKNAG